MTSTIVANMRHAVRNHETTLIGGGEFSPSEIKEAADLIEDLARLQSINADLLAALEALIDEVHPLPYGTRKHNARVAIAKAKGQK